MARTKIRKIEIRESKGSFFIFSKQGVKKEDYNFEGLSLLRQVLSNEKARILDSIKNKKPSSIYKLAKILKRPFKAVFEDIKLLERFGFINLIKEKTKKRIRYRPEIIIDHMIIHLKI